MSMQVKLSSELKGRIIHNLNRGCVPDDLVSNMISQRFEPTLALALVERFVLARETGKPILEDHLTLKVSPPSDRPEPNSRAPKQRWHVLQAG
jgi:hypothetical protein